MKTISLIVLLAAVFFGLNQLTVAQSRRQADRPIQMTLDLTALDR